MSNGVNIWTTLVALRSARKHSDFWSNLALLWIKKVLWLLLLYVGWLHVDFGLYSLMTVKCNVYWGYTTVQLDYCEGKHSTWSPETRCLSSFGWYHLVWNMWHPHGVHIHYSVTDCIFSLLLHHVLTYLSLIAMFIIQYNSSECRCLEWSNETSKKIEAVISEFIFCSQNYPFCW